MTSQKPESGTGYQSLTVLVPSRTYAIDYEVLGERFLPLVEEFLLRVVATTGNLDPKIAAQFLGLTDRECAKCLDALEQQQLVRMDADGRLELTAYARERVRNPDGVPRFVEVEQKQTVFAVDLISYQSGPSAATAGDVWREHAIELDERPRPDQRQQDRVRTAFETGFYEMNRGQRRGVQKDPTASIAKAKLHRVQNIVGRRYFTWPFPVDAFVWCEESLRTDFPFTQYTKASETEARRDLFNALRASIARMTPAVAPTVLKGFHGIFEGTPAVVALRGDRLDEVDFVRLCLERAGEDSDPTYFLGDLTQERVQNLWRDRLGDSMSRLGGGSKTIPEPLLWLPPQGGLWARSSAVRAGLETARAAMSQHKRELIAGLMVPTDSDQTPRTLSPQRHKSAFPIARGVGASRWPANVEVVLVPGRVAILLFHLRPNANCVVPVVAGFITSDKARLAAIQKLMSSNLDPIPPDPKRDWCRFEAGIPPELARAFSSVIWEGGES